MSPTQALDEFIQWVTDRNPNQPEFIQAVKEVATSVMPVICANEPYRRARVLERLTEPDRIISFRVSWLDDDGNVQINRGWRVQQSNKIGPYKGGLRFHPTVNESILKFLAFEQCFKNALTGLPIGGGKGGADFDPKGRSDNEIMKFCQAYMNELYRHIGANVDIPAGDINVGSREIGYLFGQYKRIVNNFTGVLTGKDLEFGGSHVRTEATGYGLAYFVQEMLGHIGESLDQHTVVISGAGNVATYAAKKALFMGAKVISLSNSRGYLHAPEGLNDDDIQWLIEHENAFDNNLRTFAEERHGKWLAGEKPWGLKCDVALPCATQNELQLDDARTLVDNGCKLVAEGANMPCTDEAVDAFKAAGVLYAPGKASNAGGVAVSGLEIAQNASFEPLEYEHLEQKLKSIMQSIHRQCIKYGNTDEGVDYVLGANVAGFIKLARATVAQGIT